MSSDNNKAAKRGFAIGQKLYFVASDRRGSRSDYEVEVTKIGRKWITVDRGWQQMRFDPETMWVDGGQYASPGRCYLSRLDYQERSRLLDAWANLRATLNNMPQPPNGVSVEDINFAASTLRLSVKR